MYTYGDKIVKESTTIDLKPYLGSTPGPEPEIDRLKDIKESIDKVEKAIHRLEPH